MAEREPADMVGRLSDVTPGTLPLDDHAQHDRWLVVRAATLDDELTPVEAAAARSLLDGCSECAALAADITAIAHATAVSVSPVRPRDFRLTPAQAADARGGILDRLGRWLATPRATIVRPLAAASLAIGIVLVVVGPSLQGPIQTPAPAPNAGAAAPAESATPNPAAILEMHAPGPTDGATGPQADTQMVPDSSAGVTTYAATAPPATVMAPQMAKETPIPAWPVSSGWRTPPPHRTRPARMRSRPPRSGPPTTRQWRSRCWGSCSQAPACSCCC